MRSKVSLRRGALAVLIVTAVVAAPGCSWFRKPNKMYAQDAQSRPLEVPPDLDLPRTDAAVSVPGEVMASGSPTVAPTPTLGFNVAGTRDEVFAKVGDALAAIEGVNIASRAQLLGAYDVGYKGSNFLVRVSEVQGGAYVSAVDPRGTAVTGEGPTQLIGALKTALSGQ